MLPIWNFLPTFFPVKNIKKCHNSKQHCSEFSYALADIELWSSDLWADDLTTVPDHTPGRNPTIFATAVIF
jgi:hypothetical protein